MTPAPILVFFHAAFLYGEPPEIKEHVAFMVAEQMGGMKACGLEAAASEIHVGINGSLESEPFEELFPDGTIFHYHGLQSRSENLTIQLIEARLKTIPFNEEAYVLYFHTKGGSFPPGDPLRTRWRNRMFHHCVLEWRKCVAALDDGIEACGCHWLTPETHPGLVENPYFAGTYFWSRASYLKTLNPIAESPAVKQHGIGAFEARYQAESWVGCGRHRPRIKDWSPGWPS